MWKPLTLVNFGNSPGTSETFLKWEWEEAHIGFFLRRPIKGLKKRRGCPQIYPKKPNRKGESL